LGRRCKTTAGASVTGSLTQYDKKEIGMRTRNRLLVGALAGLLMPVVGFTGPVNINTADAETISAELQGVGLSKAQAIVEYRQVNGPFKSADDLIAVKGIGERTLEMNRANILVDSPDQRDKK
jgi:competence protein ComEA